MKRKTEKQNVNSCCIYIYNPLPSPPLESSYIRYQSIILLTATGNESVDHSLMVRMREREGGSQVDNTASQPT